MPLQFPQGGEVRSPDQLTGQRLSAEVRPDHRDPPHVRQRPRDGRQRAEDEAVAHGLAVAAGAVLFSLYVAHFVRAFRAGAVHTSTRRAVGWLMLGAADIRPGVLHTSLQRRAIRTANIALEELDRLWIPVRRHWRLNERHYGDLQGLNKAEMAAKFGEQQVLVWRRSYDVPPPPIEPARTRPLLTPTPSSKTPPCPSRLTQRSIAIAARTARSA